MVKILTNPPANPLVGQLYTDINTMSTRVYDGKVWQIIYGLEGTPPALHIDLIKESLKNMGIKDYWFKDENLVFKSEEDMTIFKLLNEVKLYNLEPRTATIYEKIFRSR